MTEDKQGRQKVAKGANRMPSDSVFYDKLIPILLIGLGVLMLVLILVAVGMLLGFLST